VNIALLQFILISFDTFDYYDNFGLNQVYMMFCITFTKLTNFWLKKLLRYFQKMKLVLLLVCVTIFVKFMTDYKNITLYKIGIKVKLVDKLMKN